MSVTARPPTPSRRVESLPRTTKSTLLARLPLAIGCLFALHALACGGTSPRPRDSTEADGLSEENFAETRRRYLVMAPDAEGRVETRDRLLAFLAERAEPTIEAEDYPRAVRQFAEMSELLAPSDLESGARLGREMAPIAEFIVEHGSPLGDEARVLAALLVLTRIEPEQSSYQDEYHRAAEWGRLARWGTLEGGPRVDTDLLDTAPGLLTVWEEHAALAPSPEVLDQLVEFYIQMRNSLGGLSTEQAFAAPPSLSLPELRMARMLVERAPLDIASVHLQVGDLQSAMDNVERLGNRGGIEWRLRRLIEDATDPGPDGADALYELAGGFDTGKPRVTIALCRLGVRVHPGDVRFPLCLARVSTATQQWAEATGWYAEAIGLAPEVREVYDEALEQLSEMIESGLFDAESSIGRIRMIGRHAETILEERSARWPEEQSSVSLGTLHLHLGAAESAAGNLDEAEAHLRTSLELERTQATLRELALLELRTGNPQEAIELFEDALARTTQQGNSAGVEGPLSAHPSVARSELYQLLGDAYRAAGENEEALDHYRHALETLTHFAGELGRVDNEIQSQLNVRIGVLESKIGQDEQSNEAFREALAASPNNSDPYTRILAHLVMSDPDLALAEDVFRSATRGIALPREWRVYYALWVQAIAAQNAAEVSDDVNETLREQATRPGWHGRLAAFGIGEISEEELLSLAENAGQRCEALFYAAMRKLAGGDRDGMRAQLRAALETHMVGYFEYMMAQSLLARESPTITASAQ